MSSLRRKDIDLHYELSGDGPPVLLIQGVGVVGECWRPQASGLRNNFQTLIFDNRGIGRSVPCRGPVTIEAMAEDAEALLDEVGWASAHVVGHSMGGVIAQQLALNCPKRVRSLSLLCTFARGTDGGRLTPWTLWMGLRTRIGSRRMRRRPFLEMLMPQDYLQTANEDELASRVASLVGRDLAEQPPILLATGQGAPLSRLFASAKRTSINPGSGRECRARPDCIAALWADAVRSHPWRPFRGNLWRIAWSDNPESGTDKRYARPVSENG